MIKKFTIIILLLFLTGCTTPFGAIPLVSDVSVAKLQEKYNASPEVRGKYTLDGASLVRNKIVNPEKDKYKNEPKDEIKVRIGNKSDLLGADAEFVPSIELTRWNEVSFKIEPITGQLGAIKNKQLSFEGEKIIYEDNQRKYEMSETTEEEGGYKMGWYLKEKPATNKVEFSLTAKGLDFFYQPPLTEEYQNGYSEEFKKEIVVSETQVKDLEGNVLVERPVEVVGSYAIFHKSKGGLVDSNGKSYGTGKFGHIYRPRICDVINSCVWGELFIDANAGIYRITISQSWLDTAKYPIKSE